MARYRVLFVSFLWVNAVMADQVHSQSTMAIAKSVRCLVCQNQSVADSDAVFAVMIRDHIEDSLQKGASEAMIVEELTAKYGEKIRFNPKVQGKTALLWGLPFLCLVFSISLTRWRNKCG